MAASDWARREACRTAAQWLGGHGGGCQPLIIPRWSRPAQAGAAGEVHRPRPSSCMRRRSDHEISLDCGWRQNILSPPGTQQECGLTFDEARRDGDSSTKLYELPRRCGAVHGQVSAAATLLIRSCNACVFDAGRQQKELGRSFEYLQAPGSGKRNLVAER